jgi:WD40 repeat protein
VLACLAVVQLVVTEAVLPVVTGLASVRLPAWLGWLKPGSTRPWWVLGLVLFLALMAAAVQARVTRSPGADADPPPPSREPVPEWVVGRPAEVGHVVTALTRGRRRSRGTTVVLHGAGGFGKTTLARLVSADPRVRRRFDERVYQVTVGRDAQGSAAIAAAVNTAVGLITGNRPSYPTAREAGQNLSRVMDARPRALLVLDDVWTQEQLAPFLLGGAHWGRLVTTRMPAASFRDCDTLTVSRMTATQARAVLTAGLTELDGPVLEQLLQATGRWPLLLRLINRMLSGQADLGADLTAKGQELLGRLQAGGPGSVDSVDSLDRGAPDLLGDPEQRSRAVRSTIEASTALLDADEVTRLNELSVFAQDESVPARLAIELWKTTSGVTTSRWDGLCQRLADLGLITLKNASITSHDVVRDFLRHQVGDARLSELSRLLVDTAAVGLPAGEPLATGLPTASLSWWELPRQDRYLRDHLIGHLLDAGQAAEAEALAGDLRWVGARLETSGPLAPAADLALVATSRAERLEAALTRVAHLLAPTEPGAAVVDILHSRVATDPEWGPQVSVLRDRYQRPRLVNRWPLPDLPDSRLKRVLTIGQQRVSALAIAPDGSWLAAGSWDGSMRIWDTATGQQRAKLAQQYDRVTALAIAPDGGWLASGYFYGRLQTWDARTGEKRGTITPDKDASGRVTLITIRQGGQLQFRQSGRLWEVLAPDASWLASPDEKWGSGTVKIWDTATGQERAALTGHQGRVNAAASAPDGSWLASAGNDATVRIWDTATGQERAALTGHLGHVDAVAIAPDGSWLASAGRDATVRIWDAATGRERMTLTSYRGWVNPDALQPHRGWVTALAIAPDGSWLAAGDETGTVLIWDTSAGPEHAIQASHQHDVSRLAIAPDGSWLAASDHHSSLRIWDTATGQEKAALRHARRVAALAIAPDSSWLATSEDQGRVRVWDADSGQERAALTGSLLGDAALAIAPDSSWLAFRSGTLGTVWIWDAAANEIRATLTGHKRTGINVVNDRAGVPLAAGGDTKAWRGTMAAFVGPDGSWLATNGNDGTVRIWDTATGRERGTLTGHRGLTTVAIAPDGSWLVTAGDDGTARIWDPATWRERAALAGHRRGVAAVAIAPDSSWLATLGTDGTARIWDAAGRARAALTGHARRVAALAIAPDSSWLATSGGDGMVRIWDAAGRARAALTGQWRGVAAVAIAPDSRWLATSGGDGTVQIWDAINGQGRAHMRVDDSIIACGWLGTRGIVAGGPAGLYCFDFLSETAQPSAAS